MRSLLVGDRAETQSIACVRWGPEWPGLLAGPGIQSWHAGIGSKFGGGGRTREAAEGVVDIEMLCSCVMLWLSSLSNR